MGFEEPQVTLAVCSDLVRYLVTGVPREVLGYSSLKSKFKYRINVADTMFVVNVLF